MIRLLFSFGLFLSFTSFGQEIECQYPPTGDFTGTCESFYINGDIRSRTDFVEGMRHGDHREYHRNGELAAFATYYMEGYVGKTYRYSNDGAVLFAMELDSNETGEFIRYSQDGKLILATGQFKKSYRDGKWIQYDHFGNVISSEKYDSNETREEIYGDGTARDIYVPYDETIDKLFLEDYGLPIEVKAGTIVDFPDVAAEFPQGTDKMKEFIQKNVKYPANALKNNLEGRVYLSFVVELDGSISQVTIFRGVHGSLDQEAIRLVESMPNWKPGLYNNQVVRTKCILPITFTIQGRD